MPPRAPSDPAPRSPAPPGGRTTIDDVARDAGVSKSTVSRVLNRRDELLSRDIAERVRASIERLGYTPSPMAAALKHGRSRLIGLVVADVLNPYSVAVLRGAEKACRDAGYMVMLFNLGDDEAREREAIAALSSYQVDGLILHTQGREAQPLRDADRHGKPVVLVDRRIGGAEFDFVGLDNAGAVAQAVAHLREAGYRELAFVSQPVQGMSSRQERAAAFREAAAAAGVAGATVIESDGDAASLAAALEPLRVRAGASRLGVISANAPMTLHLVAAAASRGWRLGPDLGLIGFDDTDWAPHVGPGLSALAQPTDDIGREAVRCLLDRLDGHAGPPRQIRLAARLVARGSTQPLR